MVQIPATERLSVLDNKIVAIVPQNEFELIWPTTDGIFRYIIAIPADGDINDIGMQTDPAY